MKIKNTITGSLAAFAVFASQASAEIVLTDDLSLSGYIDIWLDSLDSEGVPACASVAPVNSWHLNISVVPLKRASPRIGANTISKASTPASTI